KVSNIFKSDSLYTKALALARRNLSRNTYDKMFPVTLFDEAFCHGLASVAYLHKKWYKITGDEKFYNLYEFLIKDIVERGDKIDGLAGYKKIINRNETINSIGLLDGVVGIGIVLIDYLLGDNNTGWDSFFLLD
ncbi:MAG: lanthionine synthetase LanC family protein, partial [Flavobacteriaceae bacterium]|nr:lanthionine synthetase LanC family protein [Flavobacteriaceae bacterium]